MAYCINNYPLFDSTGHLYQLSGGPFNAKQPLVASECNYSFVWRCLSTYSVHLEQIHTIARNKIWYFYLASIKWMFIKSDLDGIYGWEKRQEKDRHLYRQCQTYLYSLHHRAICWEAKYRISVVTPVSCKRRAILRWQQMVPLASDGLQGWELLVWCQHAAPALPVPLCMWMYTMLFICVQRREQEPSSFPYASVCGARGRFEFERR